jgi:hypothetical protein
MVIKNLLIALLELPTGQPRQSPIAQNSRSLITNIYRTQIRRAFIPQKDRRDILKDKEHFLTDQKLSKIFLFQEDHRDVLLRDRQDIILKDQQDSFLLIATVPEPRPISSQHNQLDDRFSIDDCDRFRSAISDAPSALSDHIS